MGAGIRRADWRPGAELVMKCISVLSTLPDPQAAGASILDRLAGAFSGDRADLVALFASPHLAGSLHPIALAILERGLARHVLGTTGEAIVAENREVESAPALGAWAIRLPDGARLTPIRIEADDSVEMDAARVALTDLDPERGAVILLADPFTFRADEWLKSVEAAKPGMRVFGGMASGGQRPGVNRLVLDREVFDSGAVGMGLEGPFRISSIVSQGCRPIGRPLVITRAEGNLIKELGRRPSVEVFQEIFEELGGHEQALAREGLHLGRVINEYQDSFGPGDFLVRNVIGATEEGAIAITDAVHVGQTVQFHVRDAATADEDFRSLLNTRRGGKVDGALLFTCNGRGSRLFTEPNHDVSAIHQSLGPVPVAGFFAMGEFGPVGGQNFVHGFTASVALFGELDR
jgi:small ligand-binding sensory domain FIST